MGYGHPKVRKSLKALHGPILCNWDDNEVVYSGLEQYRFDDVTVQPGAFRVEKSGQLLALEPKSIRLLVYLIAHRARAVAKEELLHEIWADAAVTDNALTRVVAQLRKALGDDAKVARYIETIPTFGYRFISEVTAVGPEPQPGVPTAAPAIAPVSLPIWTRTPTKIAGAAVLALAGIIGALVWEWRSAESPAWSGNPLGVSVNASYSRIAPDGQMLAFRAIVDGEWQLAIMKPDTEVGQAQGILRRRPPGSVLFATFHEWASMVPELYTWRCLGGRWLKLEAGAGGHRGRLGGETRCSIARVEAGDGG